MTDAALNVTVVDPGELHDLRRLVLRGADPAADVVEPRDDDPRALHLAGSVGGVIVVCASIFAAPFPPDPGDDDHQLRFMATDPAVQGRGLGAAVLAEAERRLRVDATTRLWAYARDSALGFYRAVGWHVVPGSEFVSVDTGLPHTMIVKPLVDE
ncbi:MAG: GNAT family N-acetyltransferase [Acidimicrobiales bacterium]